MPGGFLPSGILLSGEAYSSKEHGRAGKRPGVDGQAPAGSRRERKECADQQSVARTQHFANQSAGLLCARRASAHDVSWGAQAAGLLAAAASRRGVEFWQSSSRVATPGYCWSLDL